MDKILPKSKKRMKYVKSLSIAIIIIIFLFLFRACINQKIISGKLIYKDLNTFKVEKKDLDVSFSMDALVKPLNTYNLESSVGGKIIKIYKNLGDSVKAGDLIMSLENNELLLQFISQETAVTEQINNLNTAKIQGSQNQLSQKRLLTDYEYLLTKMTRTFSNKKKLYENKYISEEEFLDAQDDLESNRLKYAYLKEEIKNDSLMRATQIKQLEQAMTQIRFSLDQMKAKVQDLNIKAPISGVLTEMDMKLGQIISSGSKIALIEDLSKLYVEASVNQFYSAQLTTHLDVIYTSADKVYKLHIDKINPKLNNDMLKMDLSGEIAPELKSGQRISCDVISSKLKDALVIPLGEYLQQTDYQWVFVINKAKTKAEKRKISLGKRNLNEIELVSGLKEGEEVLTSSYQDFLKKEFLILK